MKGGDDPVQVAEVVQMVGVHVEDDADGGGHLKIVILKFAGLAHHGVVGAGVAVGVDDRQTTADEDAGVGAGSQQSMAEHRRGGGLAVGARHRDGIAKLTGDSTQQDGPLHHRDASFCRGDEFGIVGGDGGGVHHQICPLHVGGGVTQRDGNA